MIRRLIQAIQEALQPRWEARLPGVMADSRGLEVGLSPQEAYQEGYRRAYWDAVEDMVQAELLRDPDEVRIPLRPSADVVAALTKVDN